MAWVRLDDRAMTHPKIIGLSDKAFRLWVWGLSYAQQHLTDGLLPKDAVPARDRRAVEALLSQVLWERHSVGFKIHDYLDWNDSREIVLKKRSEARDRMTKAREVRANFQRENFGRSSTWRGVVTSSLEEGSGEKPIRACPNDPPCPPGTTAFDCDKRAKLLKGKAAS